MSLDRAVSLATAAALSVLGAACGSRERAAQPQIDRHMLRIVDQHVPIGSSKAYVRGLMGDPDFERSGVWCIGSPPGVLSDVWHYYRPAMAHTSRGRPWVVARIEFRDGKVTLVESGGPGQ